MNDKQNLSELLRAEEQKLEKLEAKRIEIDTKIKNTKTNIGKYKLLLNNYRFNELSNALDDKGIGINDILEAIQSGDFGSIQNKITSEQQTDCNGLK